MATIVNISGTGDANYCYAQVNGTKYTKAASNITLTSNTIVFEVFGNGTSFPGVVTIDGNTVLSYELGSATYSWTVPSNVTEINIVLTDKGYCTLVDVTTKKSGDSGGGDSGEHYTLISGTAREIEGMTVNIGGVLREIESGLVLVNGVAREIEFVKKEMVVMTFTNAPTSAVEKVTVDGKDYTTAGTHEIEKGSAVKFSVKAVAAGAIAIIRLNSKNVLTSYNEVWSEYDYVANGSISVTFNGTSDSGFGRGYINITEL